MVDTENRSSIPRSECPSQDVLVEYFLGMSDDFVSDRIDEHISECESCNQQLSELESTQGSLLRETLRDPSLHDLSDPPPEEAQRAVDDAWRAAQQSLRENVAAGASPISVGQYKILERIGRGGMGSVYRAEHSQLKKVVALKLIPIHWSHPQTLQRFEREIRAAGQLQHPGIVTATDAGTQSGMQYLAMEFVDGLDLGKLTRSISPIPTADACEIARQLALALAHAHQLGIIHRDIKPSNVMLDRTGRVKLLDFGLVYFHRWDGPIGELTTVGQFLGTLDYMAPEQAERSEVVDARSDLYSLGATLFKLLTGQTPLAMTPHQSPIEKLKRLSHHQPIQLQTLRPDLPSELCDVVNRLLATHPESRLPSALHVAEALAPFCEASDLAGLATRGLQNDHARVLDIDAETAGMRVAAPVPQPTLNVSNRRLPPVWVWVALASLPLFGFFGWRLLLESDQGNLVIESSSDTTKIEVKRRAGGAAREWLVEPGAQLTRLQAGEYDITIHEGSDQLSIEPNQVQLRRGETVVARIVRSPKAQDLTRQSGVLSTGAYAMPEEGRRHVFLGILLPESVETILFTGKTLAEWLRVMERERDPAAWREAFEVIQRVDPQLLQSLAEPIRTMGLQNNFFNVRSNGWFLPVFSHEEFDRLVLEEMQNMPSRLSFDILGYVTKLPKRKTRDGEFYRADRLSKVWEFVEQRLAGTAPLIAPMMSPQSDDLLFLWDTSRFETLSELNDLSFLKQYPWLRFMKERAARKTNFEGFSDDFLESISTLLSAPSMDLDRFLFLASVLVGNQYVSEGNIEKCNLQIRNRLSTELLRWAESGKVLGGLGMGPTILAPVYDGIGFGRNNSTNGGGGGMGGMGGMVGGMDPNARIERGLELLALCSLMPLEQRPTDAIEQLATLMSRLAGDALESKSPEDISWLSVYTFDNNFLGARTSGRMRLLNETEIAMGLLRWLSQLRFGDMIRPNEVVNNFWYALQHPMERDPLAWVVESGRDQTKIDRLLKALPDSLVDLELAIDRVDQENDRNVQRGGLRIGPGMGAGTNRIEVILKLETAGWRVAAFKYGTEIIEF